MKQRRLLVLIIVMALLAAAVLARRMWFAAVASNFEECAAMGYPVMESYPRQCRTPNGRLFVEDVLVQPL